MASTDNSFVTNSTCLHVSDLLKSKKWYYDAFKMKVIEEVTTDKFTSAFLAFDSEGQPNAGLKLTHRNGVIELRQLKNSAAKICNGNSDPYKGFGHLCVSVSNIVEAQKHLLAEGVDFKKRLEDGRQKNIAFVLDPDQYWIELIENEINKKDGVYDFSSNRMNHTMVRIRDPMNSLTFYKDILGMKLYSTRDFPDAKFTLYFLGYEHDPSYIENKETPVPQAARQSIIELTHNWGTEDDNSFPGYYVFGKDNGVIGFDHFSVSCKDAKKFAQKLGDTVNWIDKFGENTENKDVAVISDPDGWKIYIQSYEN